MTNIVVKCAVLGLTVLTCTLLAAGPDGKEEPSVIMRRKLEHTQRVLEGLAMNDLEMVAKNARIMNTFTILEEHTRAKSKPYRLQLEIFRFANDELIRSAQEKNLESATIAYTQLTMSCVNCHRLLRDK